MGSGVVTVGRRQYAAGLYWENSSGGRLAQTAKEAARQPGQQADFYALRAGNKSGRLPQFGLGQLAAGHKAGMPVFAACLANQQPGSWAGAFRLREGTVIIIVRDDLIVPDGDQFFLNESEARDRLLQEVGFGGLQRIYAPESWAISGADTMPVSLLMDERRDVRLHMVTIPKKTLVIGAAAAGILVLVLAGGWFYQQQQEEKQAEELARLNALQKLNQQIANPFQSAATPYPPPERKWETKPPALDVVEACRAGLAHAPAAVAGWQITGAKCENAALKVNWQRTKGISRPPEDATVNDVASNATQTIPLRAVGVRGPENLVNSDVVTRRFLAQDWPGSLTRLPDDPPPPPPQGFQGNWTPPPPPWVKRSFTVTVSELPSSLPTYFGNLPGVVIDSLSYSGGTWTINGVIYENRT